MRKNPPLSFFVLLFLFGISSCHTSYQSQSLYYKNYRINDSLQKDSEILGLLRPYMEHKTQPYKIFKKGKLKIGVFGVSIEGHGLIPDNLFGNTKYLDPVQKANEAADELKKNENCDMIICKSHLGINIRIIK
jgi:hypothetical protein